MAMADVTYYVALPFLQDDDGAPVAGAAEECQSSTTALRRAEMMSRMAGSIGAVAFSRTGDPMIGEDSATRSCCGNSATCRTIWAAFRC